MINSNLIEVYSFIVSYPYFLPKLADFICIILKLKYKLRNDINKFTTFSLVPIG